MKCIYISIFILNIKNIFLLTPIWNLETTADNLLKNEETVTYKISDGGWAKLYNNSKVLLEKQLTKSNNGIIEKNYFQLNNFTKKEVSWDDIESSFDTNGYFICPASSYPMLEYKDGNLYEIKPYDLSGNWEIHCSQQNYNNKMLFVFLNSEYSSKLYDFKWKENSEDGNLPMNIVSFKDNQMFYLK